MITKKVTKKDARPAGKPNECFYCQQPLGGMHKYECVCNDHKVKVRYSFDIEIMMPRSFSAEDIAFNRNESTWCADSAIDELTELIKKRKGQCLCDIFCCEVLDS